MDLDVTKVGVVTPQLPSCNNMFRPKRKHVARTYHPYVTSEPLGDDRDSAFYYQAGLRHSVSSTKAQNEREMRENLALTAVRQSQLRQHIATSSDPQVDAIMAGNALPSAAGGELEDSLFSDDPPVTGSPSEPGIILDCDLDDEDSAWVDEPNSSSSAVVIYECEVTAPTAGQISSMPRWKNLQGLG
ncbi:hypothetical protein DL96DRAFT_1558300 [Flagelloscypha sp. PMI_526]|nr:hypothetical protein DL96DRAFT_1558300 [Flagelloscypha sp. PMI_526]